MEQRLGASLRRRWRPNGDGAVVADADAVDRFEFAAVDGDQFGAAEVPGAAAEVAVLEPGLAGGAVVLA